MWLDPKSGIATSPPAREGGREVYVSGRPFPDIRAPLLRAALHPQRRGAAGDEG